MYLSDELYCQKLRYTLYLTKKAYEVRWNYFWLVHLKYRTALSIEYEI